MGLVFCTRTRLAAWSKRLWIPRRHNLDALLKGDRSISLRAGPKAPSATISVPCKSNGTINVDVYRSEKQPSGQRHSSNAVIYLPRGPILSDLSEDDANISLLTSTLPCPVIKINYRYGEDHKFPTPVHDVMAGYDWIQHNVMPKSQVVCAGHSEQLGRIAVCGELFGGQLAAVLALTECRRGEPGVVAAALNNPIVNWVAVDNLYEVNKPRQRSSNDYHSAFPDLETLRTSLFRKPEHYFDAFASPMLLFRSAGVAVPSQTPAGAALADEMVEVALSERADLYGEAFSRPLMTERLSTGEEIEEGKKIRKSTYRFPAKALGLCLPAFHVAAGAGSPLYEQAEELCRHLTRSFERQMRTDVGIAVPGFNDSVAQCLVHELPGLGLWDASDTGRASMFDVAQWIARKLDH